MSNLPPTPKHPFIDPPAPSAIDMRTGMEVLDGGPPPRPMPRLDYAYDRVRDVLTVEGIAYAGEMFRQLGGAMPIDTPLKIMARDDCVLTVVQLDPWDHDWGTHPEDHDPDGFIWRYELRDFNRYMAICGIKSQGPDQERYGAYFELRRAKRFDRAENLDLIARAKALCRQRIAEGRGIPGDNIVEGNEERIE